MTVLRMYPDHGPPMDQPENTLTGPETADAAGISFRQLDYWTRTGKIRALPRGPDASSGRPRYYPPEEVAAVTLMADLVRDGLQPNAAIAYARELLETGTTRIAGMTVHLPQDL